MKLIVIAIIAVMLSSCSLFHTKEIEVSTKPIERIDLILPEADRIYKRNVKWYVITRENSEEVFNSIAKAGNQVALIGVTGEGYEVLTMSMGDKLQLIQQLQAQISAYKSYYIAVEERDTKHNKEAAKTK